MMIKMQFNNRRIRPRRQSMYCKGFSLVELMVGTVIAMLTFLAIAMTLSSLTVQKRTTTSGSDAQTSGTLASYTLERDLRMAGFGIDFGYPSAPYDAFCTVNAYDNATGQPFNFSLAPIQINAQAADTSDEITLLYGNSDQVVSTKFASLFKNVAVGGKNYDLNNSGTGFLPGNLMVVVARTSSPSNACTMTEVTGAANPATATPISSAATSYLSPTLLDPGRILTSRYVFPGGTPNAFIGGDASTGDMVLNLGNRPDRDANGRLTCSEGGCPVFKTYKVVNNQLVVVNNLVGAPDADKEALPIADNIVMFKVIFGKDTNKDDAVDTWDTSIDVAGKPSWTVWKQVRAVRFAIVARSQNKEPTQVSPEKLTLWPGNDMALTDDQRYFRYRVYHTIVPVRNNLWKQGNEP